MESLPTGLLIEYNSDTIQSVRKEYNLDNPGRMNESLDILEDWVKKQNHFTRKDFSRGYLERTLITTKGLIERAKSRLDKLCTFRTLMPNFFDHSDIEKTIAALDGIITHGHLPKQTEDNYRVYFYKQVSDKLESSTILSYYKYLIIVSEYVKRYDYTTGFILVLDLTDSIIMNLVTKLNVMELRQCLTILMDGYGMRVKGIHFKAPSKMIDALVSIVKSVLSEKLAERIHVHKTVETLYDYVPRDILPVEYGGKERPLKTLNEDWIRTIRSEEYREYLKVMSQTKTDESCRQAGKFNEEYVGMPGSFRSLSVD